MPESESGGRGELAIRCRGLAKRFGETVALRSVDLEVRRGECFGLLGPNGAGKTTTIEILEGLQFPDAGEVEVLGLGWADSSAELRSRLGIQLQETELPERLKVREVVALFRAMTPRGPTVESLIDQVLLGDKSGSLVRQLSGGQKQRLSLACALAGDPDILFLDEPTTGLDPQSRRHIWDICNEFRARGGTILLTTHFMDEAERLADRLAIIDQGKVLVEGSPRELIAGLGGDHIVDFEMSAPLDPSVYSTLPAVTRVDSVVGHQRLATLAPHRTIQALFQLAEQSGVEMTALSTHNATLDDVFLAMTGRQLRDN
ncbi:MAG: ABC transporter ATP-binding protein [Gemmatimonadota bacterium]|jgi:ABC-2 type transport system ATP-binding protein|nr:ABC transporter ATP-binding protein [Gemmatimonadota bacterium]